MISYDTLIMCAIYCIGCRTQIKGIDILVFHIKRILELGRKFKLSVTVRLRMKVEYRCLQTFPQRSLLADFYVF